MPRSVLREALVKYLHDRIRISGYYHYDKKGDYEQETEDVHSIIAHKTAKDLIMARASESFTLDEIRLNFFGQN